MRQTGTVSTYRIAEVAEILSVSDDTVRRWIDAGRLKTQTVDGRASILGTDLAEFAEQLIEPTQSTERDRIRASSVSARNRMWCPS